ncbi:ninjurin-B isoform X1 [Drosophila virilis]|uniref:ninjurin-B isoform X1 n=1 Tax=Drosophila virilis TaxID=7244 RepID=UPI0013960C37|nr:uncharacterized protein LOC6623646 isoform X1 [Drosophila virilis]
MVSVSEEVIEIEDALSSEGSFASTVAGQCCGPEHELDDRQAVQLNDVAATAEAKGKNSPSELSGGHNYATSKNVAEGLMDIALLSANANQLRFLITYNHEASTFYCSLVLVILSLVLQVLVGIALIFKVCQCVIYIYCCLLNSANRLGSPSTAPPETLPQSTIYANQRGACDGRFSYHCYQCAAGCIYHNRRTCELNY